MQGQILKIFKKVNYIDITVDQDKLVNRFP